VQEEAVEQVELEAQLLGVILALMAQEVEMVVLK
jgi:hypothetical protein